MIQFSLILHHNMGIKCAEDPFNMGMFFDIRCPSLWVHFQTPNTHIRAFHTGVAPPPPGISGYNRNVQAQTTLYILVYWTPAVHSPATVLVQPAS